MEEEVEGISHGCTKTWWKVPQMHRKLTEVHWWFCRRKESWHKFSGCMESWRKFADSPMNTCKIAVKSHGRTESSQKLMESLADTRKVDGWSTGHRECWRKVPQPHRKLTEGLLDARKAYKSSQGRTDSWLKLTEGPAAARNVSGGPMDAQNVDRNWQKEPRIHGELTKVDRRYHRRTESWLNVSLTHENLTHAPVDALRIDWRWWKVPWMHGKLTVAWRKVSQMQGKLTEVDKRSCKRTEIWWKLKEGPAVAQKVNGRLWMVPRLHKKWQKFT